MHEKTQKIINQERSSLILALEERQSLATGVNPWKTSPC